MKTAFVVTGERGNYSDWRLWLVAAFSTMERAETFRAFIDGFRRGLCDQTKAMYGQWESMTMELEGKCFDHINARAGEIGLTAASAFGITEPISIDVICRPDGYGNAIEYKVVELPWDTNLAGGIPK